MKLRITHETHYRYSEPVSLSIHLLYLRPREHAHQRLERYALTVTPPAALSTCLDPQENQLVQVRFPETAAEFRISTEVIVENDDENPFDFILRDYAIAFPFTYEPSLAFALGPYLAPPFASTQRALQAWLDEHFATRPPHTIALLSALNLLIFEHFTYKRREEHGIQPSLTTIKVGSGACRDFAVLLVELCRTLGLAARFVSGYLFAPDGDDHRTIGAMHAWAEVFLPGAGWRALDPTHGIWCDDRFIAVAHAAQAEEVNPVQGKIYCNNPVQSQLDVTVMVERLTPSPSSH